MKLSGSILDALTVCTAVAMLAGCGGSQTPNGTTQPSVEQGGIGPEFNGAREVLTATRVTTVKLENTDPCSKTPPVTYGWKFRTSGTAKGYISGTFSANGWWVDHEGAPKSFWFFVELFTIKDQAHHQYVGAMSAGSPQRAPGFSCKPRIGGPFKLPYWTTGGNSRATINTIKANDFRERLSNL